MDRSPNPIWKNTPNSNRKKVFAAENNFTLQSEGVTSEKMERRGVWYILKRFAEHTTAHGFGQVVLSEHSYVKSLWIVIIAVLAVILCFQIDILVKKFMSRPVATKISLVAEKSPVFPVMVLCNENMIKKSGRKEIMKILGNTNFTKLRKDQIRDYISQLDSEKIIKYSHQLNETIVSCYWKNIEDCSSAASWNSIWHPKLGQCFVFNSGFRANGEETVVHSVSRSGPLSGLDFTLNINFDEYDVKLTETAGMRLYIGDQGEFYSPYTKGLSLSSGFSYNIALTKTLIQRIDPFFNNSCIKHERIEFSNKTFGQKVITKYSREFCYHRCLSKVMIEKCKCTPNYLPTRKNLNISQCRRINQKCVDSVTAMWVSGDMPCIQNCNAPCLEVSYEPHITMQRYPVFNKDGKANISHHQATNFLKVSVYLRDLEYTHIQDYKFYEIENLLADVGGQLGFFNGYSILTIAEIILLAVQLFVAFFYLCWNKRYL